MIDKNYFYHKVAQRISSADGHKGHKV